MPLAQLCHLAFVEGVPDGGAISSNLRAITWKLLLRYLQLFLVFVYSGEHAVNPSATTFLLATIAPLPAFTTSIQCVEFHLDSVQF